MVLDSNAQGMFNSGAGRGTRSYLRRKNSMSVLDVLWYKEHTIASVARKTGLSRTAAESVVSDLVTLGWVSPIAPPLNVKDAQPGRPAVKFRLNRTIGIVAGVDIGAHHVSAAVANLHGERISTRIEIVDESLPSKQRLALATSVLEAALESVDLSLKDLWALTIGSPGVIDDGQIIHFGGSGMPGWIGLNIREYFENLVTCAIVVEGDCALGAVAEQHTGAAQDADSLVYLLCGVRVGAAVVIDGALHRGSRGGAGLVGELSELRWRDIEHETYFTGTNPQPRSARSAIFEAARTGDRESRRAASDFASALALGAAAMVLAIDPEMVVIGGPSAQYSDVFLDDFTSALAQHCPIVPTVQASTIGTDAVLIGCVNMSLVHVRKALLESIESNPSFPAPSSEVIKELA